MNELPTPISPSYREPRTGLAGELSRCSDAADSLRAIASASVAMRAWLDQDPDTYLPMVRRWLEHVEVEARRAALHVCPISRANEEARR